MRERRSSGWKPLRYAFALLSAALIGSGTEVLAGLVAIEHGYSTYTLWDVDTTNGQLSNPRPASTAPGDSPNMIAFWNGTLYAVSQGSFPPGGHLYEVDIATGQPTLIATMNMFVYVEGDIAIDPTTGVLYALESGGNLFTIEKTNGIGTLIGDLTTANVDFSMMAFNPSGELFVVDTMNQAVLKVNKTNATVISTVPLSSSPGEPGGMAFDPLTGVAYFAAGPPPAPPLKRLDVNSGLVTPLGPMSGITKYVPALTWVQNGFCGECTLPCAGAHWLALPAKSNYRRAEDLCAIPGVLSVAQGLPGSSTRFLYDCSTPCNPKEAGSGDCDPVAAGAQPTDCFCINPGEGFEVQTSGSITLQVTGYDNLVPLSTPALPNGNYISLPYHRPPTLVTAADAHTAIGSTAGSAQLSRFNACTSTVQSHIAGSASPFPLAGPCEAYAFSDPVAHTYANPVGSGPSGLPTCVSQAAHLYCISGTSTNVGYSWLLDFSPPGAGGGDIGPVSAPAVPPVGAPASALAAAFIQSISAAGGTAIAAGGDCFQVSGSGAFTLYVGPVGSSPTCAVGPGGCSYNPLITLGMPEQAAPEMPASGPAGLVILAITLMGISIAMLSRKRRD